MNITDQTIETDPIEKSLKDFVKNQKGFGTRLKCTQKLEEILEQASRAAVRHILNDLTFWEECEIESFANRDELAATIDLLLMSTMTKKRALIVDWKRVGSLSAEKIWTYARDPQPPVYTHLVRVQYPGYKVDFEYRFILPEETQCRVIPCTPTDSELNQLLREYNSRYAIMKVLNSNQSWPRNSASCHDFNSVCACVDVCFGKARQLPPKIDQLLLNQVSHILVFDQCPRKYAETIGQAEAQQADFHDIGQPNIYAQWGTMFHLAIGAMYAQILERNAL